MKGFELVRGIISDALTIQLTTQGVVPVYFPIPVSDVATHVIARLKNAGYSIVKDIPDSERKEYPRSTPLMDTQAGFDVAAREVKELRHQQGKQVSDPSLPYEQFKDWPIDPSDYDED